MAFSVFLQLHGMRIRFNLGKLKKCKQSLQDIDLEVFLCLQTKIDRCIAREVSLYFATFQFINFFNVQRIRSSPGDQGARA